MTSDKKSKSPPTSQITDTVQFFKDATASYYQFEQNIFALVNKLRTISPQQLQVDCKNLRDEKAQLEIIDKQMLDIIKLAGNTITQEQIIDDFRVALARARRASDALFAELHIIKEMLQDEISDKIEFEKIFDM